MRAGANGPTRSGGRSFVSPEGERGAQRGPARGPESFSSQEAKQSPVNSKPQVSPLHWAGALFRACSLAREVRSCLFVFFLSLGAQTPSPFGLQQAPPVTLALCYPQ